MKAVLHIYLVFTTLPSAANSTHIVVYKPYRIKSTHGGEGGRTYPCRESIGYRQLWSKSLYSLSKAFNINSCFWKLPVVTIILVFMYFRFSFADWHSVISSLNTTYGTIVAVNWRKFQIAHFTKPDCFRTLSLIDGLCCYPLLRLGAVP